MGKQPAGEYSAHDIRSFQGHRKVTALDSLAQPDPIDRPALGNLLAKVRHNSKMIGIVLASIALLRRILLGQLLPGVAQFFLCIRGLG